MFSRRTVAILLVALCSLLVVGTAEAKKKPAKPSARDRADVRAFFNASLGFNNSASFDEATDAAAIDAALALCPTALEGATDDQVKRAKQEILDWHSFQSVVPPYRAFSQKLIKRKAKNRTLKSVASATGVIAGGLETLAAVQVDICTFGEAWKAQGYADAAIDAWWDEQLGATAFDDAAHSRAQALIRGSRAMLIKLGLTGNEAKVFISLATLS